MFRLPILPLVLSLGIITIIRWRLVRPGPPLGMCTVIHLEIKFIHLYNEVVGFISLCVKEWTGRIKSCLVSNGHAS